MHKPSLEIRSTRDELDRRKPKVRARNVQAKAISARVKEREIDAQLGIRRSDKPMEVRKPKKHKKKRRRSEDMLDSRKRVPGHFGG